MRPSGGASPWPPICANTWKLSHHWSAEADGEDWWGLLHAIFILGFMTGEDADQGLLHAIKRMDTERDNDLWDWLGGYWPALLRNKRAELSQQLQAIESDRDLDWYPRSTAQECLLETAHASGPEALDEMLQHIARTAADETEDWDYRLSSTHQLLAFPRESHDRSSNDWSSNRNNMTGFPYYDRLEVDEAYSQMQDSPEWEQFDDPLEFYDPMNILNRQIRWAEEDEKRMQDEGLSEDSFDLPYDHQPITPFVRDDPQGRPQRPLPLRQRQEIQEVLLEEVALSEIATHPYPNERSPPPGEGRDRGGELK